MARRDALSPVPWRRSAEAALSAGEFVTISGAPAAVARGAERSTENPSAEPAWRVENRVLHTRQPMATRYASGIARCTASCAERDVIAALVSRDECAALLARIVGHGLGAIGRTRAARAGRSSRDAGVHVARRRAGRRALRRGERRQRLRSRPHDVRNRRGPARACPSGRGSRASRSPSSSPCSKSVATSWPRSASSRCRPAACCFLASDGRRRERVGDVVRYLGDVARVASSQRGRPRRGRRLRQGSTASARSNAQTT